jgi:hypothetical protein
MVIRPRPHQDVDCGVCIFITEKKIIANAEKDSRSLFGAEMKDR